MERLTNALEWIRGQRKKLARAIRILSERVNLNTIARIEPCYVLEEALEGIGFVNLL